MKHADLSPGYMSAGVKTCIACRKTKPIDHFPWDKKQGPIARCFPCRNEQQRAYWRQRMERERALHPTKVKPISARQRGDEIRACAEAGMTAREASKALNLNLRSIQRARIELGLPRFRRPMPPLINPSWNDQRLVRLAMLWGKASYAQIGLRLGVTRSAISGAVNRHRKRIVELQANEARQSMGHR